MTRRARCLAAFVIGMSAAAAARAQAQQPTQVIPRAELEAAGWTRLSELAFAVRGAARASVDGISVLADLTGLPAWQTAPGRDDWLVLVDGQPLAVSFAGVGMLDLLPVALAQVESVTVHHGPAVVAGRLAPRGALHLHTQGGLRGGHGSVSHYSGNEVGDPGPFTFTPARAPNVDNSGPFHQARLTWGAARWDADLAVRRWTDNLTDPRLTARYEAAAAPATPELWVRHVAPTLRAGVATSRSRHDVHAAAAQLRGTFFAPAVQEDQSLSTRLRLAAASGSGALADAASWGYQLRAVELEASPYGAPLPTTLAHRRRDLSAAGSARARFGGTSLGALVNVSRHSLMETRFLGPSMLPWHRTDAAATLDASGAGAWHPLAAVSVGSGLAGLRASGVASLQRRLTPSSRAELRVHGESRAYGDDGAWIDLELFGVDALRAERRTSYGAETSVARSLGTGAVVRLTGAARREAGLRLLRADSATSVPAGAPGVSPALTLTLGELRAGVELPLHRRVTGGAVYRLGGALGGWDAARDARRSLPTHLLDAIVVVTPVSDIRVRSALHLASATRWSTRDGASEPVPAVTRLDVSLEKWLWRGRVRAHLLARNLFNDVERYHPLGADFRLRVYAGATLSVH